MTISGPPLSSSIHSSHPSEVESVSSATPAALLSLDSGAGARPFLWPLAAMRKEVFRKGESLFKAGDKADRMFYLHRGAVRLPEIKKIIGAGQVLGELGLFSSRSERTATAICEEDLEAYSIGRPELLAFLQKNPAMTIELMQASFRRLLDHERAEAEARERIESELRIAREIQVSMLPCALPPAASRQRVAIHAAMQPAKEVGGDFYDYFDLGRERVCLLIGDASGKGIPAAMFVAVGKSLLKAEARRGGRPHEIVARVNEALCYDNSLCMFITLVCLTLNTRSGQVECCCAGHEYPLLCRAKGAAEVVRLPAGKAIGVLPGAQYASRRFRLEPGDTLFLYTDGVTEAVNSRQQCFSKERLLRFMANLGQCELPEMLSRVNEAVDTYRGSEPQSDDITLAALRFLGASKNIPG